MQFDFRIAPIPLDHFEELFSLRDEDLAARGAQRLIVDAKPGYPCRVSLVDAEIGEAVILAPFKHHDVDSPYRATGPVFVREKARTARLGPNEIPPMLLHRLLSVRAYDRAAMMKDAEVVEGRSLNETIRHFFANPAVAYLHVHNAAPGCFNCVVQRA